MPMMWNTDEVPMVYLTALCAWREARGESEEGIRGVLHVIHNRGKKSSWWGSGHVGCILKPLQFSCFNRDDPNATKFPDDGNPLFRRILELTANVLVGQDEDLTGGATHYHEQNVFPDWAAKLKRTATIGHHFFYKE